MTDHNLYHTTTVINRKISTVTAILLFGNVISSMLNLLIIIMGDGNILTLVALLTNLIVAVILYLISPVK